MPGPDIIKPFYPIHRTNARQKSRKSEKIVWRPSPGRSTIFGMITCKVVQDPVSVDLSAEFDLSWDGTTSFSPWEKPQVPTTYGIGLIVGPSGSGKTKLLDLFGSPELIQWDPRKSIASHFANPQEAHEKLAAVGLNSVPTWLKPYHVLSTGEMFRARLARQLKTGAVIDEYTSVVDRNVAIATSAAIRKYLDRTQYTNIVFASCHFDIIRWLEPDWTFNTATGILDARGRVQRPAIHLDVHRTNWRTWSLFRSHHYLSHEMHKQAQCFIGLWSGRPVVFTAVLAFPHPKFRKAFREHRTVVLPDYQGIGIGPHFSDSIAQLYIDQGCRYYSRTSHPRMGKYRDNSPLWKPTRTNRHRQTSKKVDTSIQDHWTPDHYRCCYSHQYLGHR